MTPTFAVGDAVQTPLGKGVVREIRNGGRVLVDIDDCAVVLDGGNVRPLEISKSRGGKKRRPDVSATLADVTSSRPAGETALEIDLHGLTVEEAMARAESSINDALLSDRSELRLIHGRSGGRIRAALHRRLREIAAVRAFRIDPRNDGVTIVVF